MTTRVINIKSGAAYDVYCGRAGKGMDGTLGNPVVIGRTCPECGQVHKTGGSTLPCYHKYMSRRMEDDYRFHEKVAALYGKTLACFCVKAPWVLEAKAVLAEEIPLKSLVCHAQVLAWQANIMQATEQLLNEELFKKPKRYACTICHLNPVDAENGIDTCDSCLKKM